MNSTLALSWGLKAMHLTEDKTMKVHGFRFLDLPPELRLIIYEMSTEIKTKHHPFTLADDTSKKIEFRIVFKSTNVALLAACQKVHGEVSNILQRKLATVLASPPRMITASATLVDYQGPGDKLFSTLLSQIRQVGTMLDNRKEILLPLLTSQTPGPVSTLPQSTLHTLDQFIVRAARYRQVSLQAIPAIEIGLYREQTLHPISGLVICWNLVYHKAHFRDWNRSYGVQVSAKMLLPLCAWDGQKDQEEVMRDVYGLAANRLQSGLVESCVDVEEYMRDWV